MASSSLPARPLHVFQPRARPLHRYTDEDVTYKRKEQQCAPERWTENKELYDWWHDQVSRRTGLIPFVSAAIGTHMLLPLVEIICSYDDMSYAMTLTLMAPIDHQQLPPPANEYANPVTTADGAAAVVRASSNRWQIYQGTLPMRGVHSPVLMTPTGLVFEIFEEFDLRGIRGELNWLLRRAPLSLPTFQIQHLNLSGILTLAEEYDRPSTMIVSPYQPQMPGAVFFYSLTIRSTSPVAWDAHVHHRTSVGQLKHIIERRYGVPIDLQRIIFAGKQLEDACALAYYSITAGSTVHIVLRSIMPTTSVPYGGAPPPTSSSSSPATPSITM